MGLSEDGVLDVDYNDYSGHIRLMLDKFFPTSGRKVRLLMEQVIGLNYEDRIEITEDILAWLGKKYGPVKYRDDMASHAAKVVELRTKASEMQADIDKQEEKIRKMKEVVKSLAKSRKKQYREAIKEEKEKLRSMKTTQREMKKDASYNNGKFISLQSEDRRFKENINLIRAISAKWY